MKRWRVWIICCLCLCVGGIVLAQSQMRKAALASTEGVLDCFSIGRDIKRLYESGKCGEVTYGPRQVHQISWHPPGRKSQTLMSAPEKTAVTYGFSGGRLGDNLLSYFHARWIAYRDHVPLIRKPFPRIEEFALASEPELTVDGPVREIPYFPESTMKNLKPLFLVDWEDPGFREEMARCLAPTKPHSLLSLPADRITVCVHVRRGGTYDDESVFYSHPLKCPPDSYYIEQIRTIAHIFQGKPLYMFIMTDDLHPEAIVQRYQKAVPDINIQWDCRKKPPVQDLDDFFSIPRFDCLILCDSNFSIIASKLSEYAIQIAPTAYTKRKTTVHITGLNIVFDPAYKKVHADHEKILIAGICQNTEKAVPSIIEQAEKLGRCFQDYAVVIYENNSTDHTPDLYTKWAAQNERVHFVSETISDPSPTRTERIANARNRVLSMAKQPEFATYRYLIWVDLDFTSSWPIDRIVRIIERGGDWDMVAANGIYPDGSYYDRYALRDYKFPLGPELLGAWWRWQLEREPARIAANHLVPVFSAFGGLAIYKTESILPFSYSGLVNRDLYDYYHEILLSYHGKKQIPQIQEYLRQLGQAATPNLKPVPIVFVENTPEEHPENLRRVTCCEHVTLHAAMSRQGHGKLYIDPQMVFVNLPQD